MLTFQDIIMRLQQFWSEQGALIWQPYNEKVGAGTMNPATVLRVLGPEPWNVGYAEPSFRPDDGRYGDNPNRMQMHTQFQVILKPDPGDPQERYLRSLEALGIKREEHDIRFVEDNWESPALGAWGLGWEVWLDGMEITQFTYFQQAGGLNLEMPAVEITYGLERLAMYLQGVASVWDLAWDWQHTYGEILLRQEVDYCRYDFEFADIERVQAMYELFETEARSCLDAGLVVPALDYVLRCSHAFNLLDSRGVVGVTERASFFKRMRGLSRRLAEAYLAQREEVGFPWRGRPGLKSPAAMQGRPLRLPMGDMTAAAGESITTTHAPFVLELGVEELPASHVSEALAQLRAAVPAALAEARLEHAAVQVWGTPRRLIVFVEQLALQQPDQERVIKGPPARAAFDKDGNPTRAAEGFARSQGVQVTDLRAETLEGGEYVVVNRREAGRPAGEVLAGLLPGWMAGLRFPRSMRWNETGVAFSRPLRWIVALLGEEVIPCTYAGVESGRVTRGPRPAGSPEVALADATALKSTLASYGVVVEPEARAEVIRAQAQALAESVGGQIAGDAALLEEVTQLVETPTALLGSFEARYLELPQEALIAVMKKHQRYFPVLGAEGRLLPYFIAVRNGGREHLDLVRAGNEGVIRARYADAEYFYKQDSRRTLESFVPDLATLTFQERLGSMLDKSQRLEQLAPWLGLRLGLAPLDLQVLSRAAHLAKADLATQMVVEMTSLQGVMGREYARLSGETPAVAQAIAEHYLPAAAGGALPQSPAGFALALADRLDSLAGLFAVGLAPTGSADPYGLRRMALGLVQLLLAQSGDFSVREGLAEAARLLPVEATPEALEQAVAFVIGRLNGVLRDEGFAYDVVEAALAAQGERPFAAREAAAQLTRWVARADWAATRDNYARCVRITRDQPRLVLHPEALRLPEELALVQALLAAEAQLAGKRSVDAFFAAFQPLTPVIQRFFDAILVMDPDVTLREARLALLQRIAALPQGIVDLSKLEGF
ncbi:MAG: glycine--tRNA ligase subunit beta [Anaerolineae bacterium]|jgi:glycyl-tRNA synthetase|nr:glycine--tRNA ligase subunit beta [Anaerolineae bacterium]